MVSLILFLSRLQTKIPSLPCITYLISSKIITGFNLARDSEITFGKPSIKEGKINIYEGTHELTSQLLVVEKILLPSYFCPIVMNVRLLMCSSKCFKSTHN